MFNKFKTQISVGIFAIIWFSVGIYWLMQQPKHGVVVIDCSLVEISPDFTTEMRAACRKAQSGRI
jgi:hypothetical protein